MFNPIITELFHQSKSAIISALKRSNGLPVSQISEEVEMSYMGVKQHCINLEKMGFVESWRVPRKEVGRPEKLYRLTDKCDSLFPVSGVEMTLSLLEGVQDDLGHNAPEKLLLKHFEKKQAAWQKVLSKKSNIAEKAQKLAELREEDGYFNHYSFDNERGLTILEYHNPYEPVFEKYPKAKRFELDAIEQLLGATVKEGVVEGSHGQKQSVLEISTIGAA